MKKFLITMFAFLALSFAFAGCSSEDDKDDSTEKVLDSGKETDGSTWKLQVSEEYSEEDGKTVGISYGETSSDEKSRIGFGILKQTLNKTTSYKVVFTFQSKKVSVTEDLWNQYKLEGNSRISVSGARRFSDEQDGFSSYYLYGSITEEDVEKLKQATFITFAVSNSTNEDLETVMVLPISFQTAMMKYF